VGCPSGRVHVTSANADWQLNEEYRNCCLYVPYDDAGNGVAFAGMRLPTLSLPPLEP